MLELPDSLPIEISSFKPELAFVLGSGLGFFADERLQIVGRIPYAQIPGFPESTVSGHLGQFVYGNLCGKRVLCMQGRFHLYEGYSMAQLTHPIRLMAKCGIQTVVLTNAAGGINSTYQPGDFMLIRDHINFLGTNPLIGPCPEGDVRFPDMTEVYDFNLGSRLLSAAIKSKITLHEGVYLATTGPSFETPAEIRAFARLGADAVGMSTVPEAIVARQQGMRVVGISCITNAAAGLSKSPLTHEEVGLTAERVCPEFSELLEQTAHFALGT